MIFIWAATGGPKNLRDGLATRTPDSHLSQISLPGRRHAKLQLFAG